VLTHSWQGWGLVPGPLDFAEPCYSTDLHDPVAQYDIRVAAQTTMRVPGVELTHPAEPSWQQWSARWTTGDGGSHISLAMILLETDPPSFRGFKLDGTCAAEDLIRLWLALRRDLPSLCLQSPDCRLYKPSSFMRR
jgi:hypothetical protein